MATNDAWGLEVGANAVKAMHLVRDGDDIQVAAYEILPFKKILTTPDLNVDEAIQVNLDQLLAKHDLSKSKVVVSVPGSMAFARFAKLPPVEPSKIAAIVKFEAVQQIPFPINQVEWDYQVFQQEDSPDVEVGIFAIVKDRVATFLSNYNKMGIQIEALTLSPLAVLNTFAFDQDIRNSNEGTILMDVGTTSTDLIVVEGGRVWLRTMAIGGNNFTEAIEKAFKLSPPKAEKLKREAGTSKYARQIFQAMRPVFADMVQEIQRSLGHYQTSNRDANLTRLIGIGSTFRLPGLQKFLKQQLQLDVIRPDGFKKIKIDGKQAADFAENSLNLATVYGLALQGLDLQTVRANILPEHLIKQRLWKAKQPWIGAAAAIVLAAVGASWFKLSSIRTEYSDKRAAVDAEVKAGLGQASSLRAKVQEIVLTDQRPRIENVQRTLDYRDVWPKLIEDLGLATAMLNPQPELSKATYEDHKKIPRTQRRRIYINTFQAVYEEPTQVVVPGAPPAAATPAAPLATKRLKAEDAFGKRTPMATPEGPVPAPGTAGAPGAAPVDPANAPMLPPRFVVTITGTTPYGAATSATTRFIDDNLIKWLKTNGVRSDRPYKIIPDSVKLSVLKKITEQDIKGDTKGGPAAPTKQRGGRIVPGLNPEGAGSPLGPRGSGKLTPLGPRDPGKAEPAAQEVKDEPLFPVRPLSNESIVGDHKFEITWTVELLSPDEVRKQEEAAKQAVPAKTSSSESTPIAPAATGSTSVSKEARS